MATKEQQVATLIDELSKSTNDYDDERSLSLCNQLIKLQGENDTLPLHCKVVTLIRLGKYDEALSLIGRKFRDNSKIDLTFEKLYCYYRTNQWQQASELLDAAKTTYPNNTAVRFLEAQLLYGQDKFQQAIDIYESLLQQLDEQDPIHMEVQVNLLAAKAGLSFIQPETRFVSGLDSSDYTGCEVSYNSASIHLAEGNFARASELLELAKKQCNDRLKEQDVTQDEVDEDLTVIATQLAYSYQVQGRIDEAKKIYQDVVSLKTRDGAVKAVVANNMVVIQNTDDLFDSAKKMKLATGKEADTKLKQYQKRIISRNEALLQMFMNKHGSCKETAQRLLKQYPDMDELYVILAAATYHQHRKADKALEELKTYAKQNPSSLAIRFAAMQLELLSSQPVAALKTLEDYLNQVKDDIKATHRPAVVALLVWLYEQTGQSEKAMSVLDEASSYWKDNNQSNMSVSAKITRVESTKAPPSTTPSILKQTAAFKLKTGRFSEAADDYEQLVKADPTDTQAIAGLISAYAEIDPVKAEQYGQVLPPITTNETLNIDELEFVVPGVKKGYVKKDPSTDYAKVPKSKKKRTPLLPKTYDENKTPDAERWIPARDRSTYRVKGKAKKASARGPQGMAMEGGGIGSTGSARLAGRQQPSSTTSESTVTETTKMETPTASTPSNKNANKSKKKKKGGKSKW